MYSLLYFCKLLYMFRVVNPPIIRSTYNCNYSICHLVKLRKMQCVKSAKDERHGPVSGTFHDRTIAEGSRDGSLRFVAQCLNQLRYRVPQYIPVAYVIMPYTIWS